MSADSSPSTEPIPASTAPNKMYRLFRHWKAVGVIIVGLSVLSLAFLQPFASPQDKLIGNWTEICGRNSADRMAGTPVCLLSFTADGKMSDLRKVDINCDLPKDEPFSTYTWLDSTTIFIHARPTGIPDTKMTVRFDGWGPWLQLTLKKDGSDVEDSFSKYPPCH